MHKAWFGLRKSPFNLTPDPDFLYLTAQHREALAGLSYAILGCKGFVVLTGDAGTGKTTLLMRTMQQLPGTRAQCGIVVNPTLSPAEFLEAALLDFGFTDIPKSKARRISLLQDFLWKARQEGKISALIVDEAHKLSLEVLEEIRLLGNFESAEEKLLQIVLVGQSELDDLLNREHLRQFKQRIAMRMSIDPLAEAEVGLYIQHRWTMAGGEASPFPPEVVAGIARASQGIPRVINVICDNALTEAFVDESRTVRPEHVTTVCRDMQLAAPRWSNGNRTAPAPTPAPLVAIEVEPAMTFEWKSLERYGTVTAQPSLLARLRSKLGMAERTKSA